MMKKVLSFLVLGILVFSVFTPAYASSIPSHQKKLLNKVYKEKKAKQIVFVTADKADEFTGKITAYEYVKKKWVKKYSMPAVIGKNGISPAKKEGDGKSPAGIYDIGRSFGTVKKPSGITLKYTKTDQYDYWVDDVTSKDYNKWIVYKGDPNKRWKSFERMQLEPLYHYGAVIEYNMDPIVKGDGSAIFFHVWRASDKPTAGCTATSKENVLQLLRWMDPSKKPVFIQGTEKQMKEMY
ncbi:L,D-transpeptidase family protein [Fictibacillus enclensis]|uniref:L,D-transpeptidase family protein n=1 Tax=Fictibacillus enclensis TaxID=1017270 RepID=UPI0024BF4364|nr:L,D-transpeptidase family protein [Fictibacillus enclensis]MDM5200780.1 L,D-transpeptidase family protein [Fictibacillus enclensis]MDM5340135.1 L,D-transpeptidase family protein [Fictibacillus enclensis]WHY71656.1 L,D-transpeptidase family protein [Fictibacillus enclensis]